MAANREVTYREVKETFDELRADSVLRELPWLDPLLNGMEGFLQIGSHLDDPVSSEVESALNQLAVIRVLPLPVPDPGKFPQGTCGLLVRLREIFGPPASFEV